MTHLTENKIPWGLLDKADKDVLKAEAVACKQIQRWDGYGVWSDVEFTMLVPHPDDVYRVKPRPVRRYELHTMYPGHLTINGEEVEVKLISVQSDPSETEYGRTFRVVFEVPE